MLGLLRRVSAKRESGEGSVRAADRRGVAAALFMRGAVLRHGDGPRHLAGAPRPAQAAPPSMRERRA
jgi:hypothetical protein